MTSGIRDREKEQTDRRVGRMEHHSLQGSNYFCSNRISRRDVREREEDEGDRLPVVRPGSVCILCVCMCE